MDEQKMVYNRLSRVFSSQSLFLSQIGRDIETPTIDKITGTWTEKGLFGKSPRFIIQLKFDSHGHLEAGQFITNSTSGKLGFLNTAKNQVGGVLIRVVPVIINPNSQFEAIPKWEWLLLLTFSGPISGGGSSDALYDFFPPRNTIKWKYQQTGNSVQIKGASLFSVMPAIPIYNDSTVQPPITINYDDATQAVREYLSF